MLTAAAFALWLAAAPLLAVTPAAAASRSEELARADALSRGEQHAEAGALYEQLARRALRSPDPRLLALAAREYVAAGQPERADAVLARAGAPKSLDDAVLVARTRAELELARGRPDAALAALATLPPGLPAPLEAELLALRAAAEFRAGRTLAGVRSLLLRGQRLDGAAARQDNERLLVDALRKASSGPAGAPPAEATPAERGWLELGHILALVGSDPGSAARLSLQWRSEHPGHPGAAYLPVSLAAGPGAAGPASGGPGAPVALPAAAAARIALLLPLSGRLQAAGVAIRDGFLAAALGDDPELRPSITIYDTASLGVVQAQARALADAAQLVVGPLAKEDVAQLAAAGPPPVPMLALNSLPGGPAPALLYQFALDPEQEARAAARRVATDGLQRGVALFPADAWGQRLQAAFVGEAAVAGLTLTAVSTYAPGSQDYSGALRQALGRFGGAGDSGRSTGTGRPHRDPAAEVRDGPQFVFVAAQGRAARQLLPQLRFQMVYDVPVYATSDAVDPGARSSADLEGLRYPEIPWVLYGGQGASELWQALHGEWAVAGRGRLRLYAFGYDAYDLARELRASSTLVGLNGLTGNLSLGPDGRVGREPEWARIDGGRIEPAGLVAPTPQRRDGQ